MLSIKYLALSLVAAASLVGYMGTEAIAQRTGNVVMVAGTTNRGDKLVYEPASVYIDRSGGVMDKTRVFNYAVIKKSGEVSINVGAYTHWCRFGKVQLDMRALDIQVAGLTFVYQNVNPAKQPGWFSDKGYIVANSPASRNLLKAVCATNTSTN